MIFGFGFGGFIYFLVINVMIINLGLLWVFRIFVIVVFVVNGGCSLIFCDCNKVVGVKYVFFYLDFFKLFEYWLFLGWGFFFFMSYVIVVFFIMDYV